MYACVGVCNYINYRMHGATIKIKVMCVFVHRVVNLQNDLYTKCHSWTRFHRYRKPTVKCVLKPCFEKVSKN